MFRPRRHYGHRGGGGRGGLAIFLLAAQMFQVGFDRIPPTTLLTIAGQVAIYLKLFNFHWPHVNDVCISAINVWYKEDWSRLFLAAFFHLSEWHLYYNMVSFLWKGLTLERRLGSAYFAYMIGVFAVLCNTITVALSILCDNYFHDSSYLSQCAAGFSGVLFALKVITTHMLPAGIQRIMGVFPVPSRLAVWAELGIIHLLVPNSSFLGHLAGILVGLAYVHGPLKSVMDVVVPSEPTYTYQARSTGYHNRFWGGGRPANQQPRESPTPRPQQSNYSRFTGGLSEEEQMAQAMRNSRQQHNNGHVPSPEPSAPPEEQHTSMPTPSAPTRDTTHQHSSQSQRLYPDLSSNTVDQEELRRRRLARFQ